MSNPVKLTGFQAKNDDDLTEAADLLHRAALNFTRCATAAFNEHARLNDKARADAVQRWVDTAALDEIGGLKRVVGMLAWDAYEDGHDAAKDWRRS
jgi:hypothetical protein